MGRLVEGIGSRRRPAEDMGCRARPADVINFRGARPTRWGAGGVRRTRGNNYQDPEGVREKVKGRSTPAGFGEIHDGIER